MSVEPEPLLTPQLVVDAFALMDRLLGERGLTATVEIHGGAAIMIAMPDRRPATRDVDARYEETTALESVVAEVGRRLGLQRSWLNTQSVVYLPRGADPEAVAVWESPRLRVVRASLPRLLAMKADAARRSDRRDIALLAAELGLVSVAEVERLHDALLPDTPLDDRKREAVQEALIAGAAVPPPRRLPPSLGAGSPANGAAPGSARDA